MSFSPHYDTGYTPLEPWFRVRGFGVTSAVLITGALGLSIVVTALLQAMDSPLLVQMFFHTRLFWQGQLWRALTWPLLNPPDFWFVVSVVFLFWFGRMVEQTLGRADVLKLVGGVLAAQVLVGAVVPNTYLSGGRDIGFIVFLAYAIINPGGAMILGLAAKWWAIIAFAIRFLQEMARGDVPGMLQVVVILAATAVGLRMLGSAHSLPWLKLPEFRRAPKPGSLARESTDNRWRQEDQTIDSLLDKVAAKGLHSLSDKEREMLARHSEKLQRRR